MMRITTVTPWRRLCTLAALSTMLLCASSGWAYEQTMTCYAATDGRTPVCASNQTAAPVHWSQGCATWRTAEHFPNEFLAPLKASFETWNAVDGSYFRTFYAGSTDEVGAGYDCTQPSDVNQNVVSFIRDWPAQNVGHDVVALTSVVFVRDTGQILDADIRMNAEFFDWTNIHTVGTDPRRVDVQNVMTHEVGHFLGLDHTRKATYAGDKSAPYATMWSNTYPNETMRRALDTDDILGIEAIYPIADAPETPCQPPERLNDYRAPADYDPTHRTCEPIAQEGCNAAARTPYWRTSWFFVWMIMASVVILRRTKREH